MHNPRANQNRLHQDDVVKGLYGYQYINFFGWSSGKEITSEDGLKLKEEIEALFNEENPAEVDT